ncbi:MAG: hypothetical protein KDJ47_06655 [Hyphomicrobiaceae bacterium]|nr:hypothetical protein [Hyphomicrobiaceae bacterium]
MGGRVNSTINLPRGVMFNAYPDSLGQNLSSIVTLLQRPELENVFSLFYILPTFFNSDLDRGFSIIDYELNTELVSQDDLDRLDKLGIGLKFDLVLNHLSVGSPQFQNLLEDGDSSPFKDFFIDWNEFWHERGEMSETGYIVPDEEHLSKLFMRKPGLPILMVRFPDDSERPYWNTFYQEIRYPELTANDLSGLVPSTNGNAHEIATLVNTAIREGKKPAEIDLDNHNGFKDHVVALLEQHRTYLGQMDLNARSEKVWDFYDETLGKLARYGAKLIRLDAFAYLHKEPCESNFFNVPGTWDYLDRIRKIAEKYGLALLPEIHAEYGKALHAEVSGAGYPVYDFFFPGLVIDALDRGTTKHLLRWFREILANGIETINMLGCHDGIPVLDLKGDKARQRNLMSDGEIDAIVDRIMERGGRVKNLFGPDGKKIAYYQVNATFFSALGENEAKLRLARAIQMFAPGIPQVWYLDLFAGVNDYEAADRGGTGGHKEINRTALSHDHIEQGLKRTIVLDQLDIMRLRNRLPAFNGTLTIMDSEDHVLRLLWRDDNSSAFLEADLGTFEFSLTVTEGNETELRLEYGAN